MGEQLLLTQRAIRKPKEEEESGKKDAASKAASKEKMVKAKLENFQMDVNRKISSLYSMQMKEIDLVASSRSSWTIFQTRFVRSPSTLGSVAKVNSGEKSWLRSEYLKMLRVAFDSVADETSGTACGRAP